MSLLNRHKRHCNILITRKQDMRRSYELCLISYSLYNALPAFKLRQCPYLDVVAGGEAE